MERGLDFYLVVATTIITVVLLAFYTIASKRGWIR